MKKHENSDHFVTWYEYTQDQYFDYMADFVKYRTAGTLIHEFKQYGEPLYYLIVANNMTAEQLKREKRIFYGA